MPLTSDDCRRTAAAEEDPLMLTGPDMIHYAELLIRFYDHPVLSPGYQFWGNLADYYNRIMHLPERPGRQNDSSWSEFNGAVAMAVGYVRDVSAATTEQKLELLRKFFAPRPEPVSQCPGSGGAWGSGTGTPICPSCHLGPAGLGTKRPVRRSGRWAGLVPDHQQRTS
jgi:hypothetical protein